MNWHDVLMEAMKNPEELKRMSELARQHRHIELPKFDHKKLQSEGRQPGEDDPE